MRTTGQGIETEGRFNMSGAFNSVPVFEDGQGGRLFQLIEQVTK